MTQIKCRPKGHDMTDPKNVRTRKNGYRYCAECDRERFRKARADAKAGILPKGKTPKTHCFRGHPWTEQNTIIYRNPDGSVRQRKCRTCRNEGRKLLRQMSR